MLLAGATIIGAAATAQDTAAPTAAAQGAAALTGKLPLVRAMRFEKLPTDEAAKRLTAATKILVVADKSVGSVPLTLTTPPVAPLDRVLDEMAKMLPAGTVVKKTYLPGDVPVPDGDTVAKLIAAEEELQAGPRPLLIPAVATAVGTAGAAQTPSPEPVPLADGEMVLRGRRLAAQQAAQIATALDLQPVYLLTNPNFASDPVQRLSAAQSEMMRQWMQMDDAQKSRMMDQQFQGMLNMDPSLRRALFENQMKYGMEFMKKLSGLPDNQKRSFWLDMTQGRWDGTGQPPSGNPFGGGADKP